MIAKLRLLDDGGSERDSVLEDTLVEQSGASGSDFQVRRRDAGEASHVDDGMDEGAQLQLAAEAHIQMMLKDEK